MKVRFHLIVIDEALAGVACNTGPAAPVNVTSADAPVYNIPYTDISMPELVFKHIILHTCLSLP